MSRISLWTCVLVVIVAAVLRLTGLDRLQPHQPEPDSYLVLQTEILREGRQPDLKRSEKGYYAYPLVLAKGLALLPEAASNDGAGLDERLAAASSDYTRARTLVAWLSLLIVPATFFLARRVLDPLGATIAALLVATSLLGLYFSQQARHHAPHASFALLAVLAALQLRARPTWSSYLIAGAVSLLTVGMLHSGWFVLVPFVAAHVLRRDIGNRAPPAAALLPLAGCALAWWGLYPRTEGALDESASVSEGGHTLYWRDIDFSGLSKAAHILWDSEPGLIALAGAGALMALLRARSWWLAAGRDARSDLLVMLAYVAPYSMALAAYKETCDRMLLPVVPFLALLGAHAVSRAAALVHSSVRPLLLAAAVAVPVYGALNYVRVRDGADTLEQAVVWLEDHSAQTSARILAAPTITLPVPSDAAGLEVARDDHSSRLKRWLRFQLAAPANSGAWPLTPMPGKVFVGADLAKARERLVNFLEHSAPEWIVLDVTRYSRVNPLAAALREWAEQHGVLEATLRGEPDEWRFEPSLDYQDVPSLFTRLAHATAFGPAIEIYRVRR